MSTERDESLDREVESALEGVNLQELDEEGRTPAQRKDAGLMRGTVTGTSGDDVIVELGPRMQGVISGQEFDTPPAVGDQFDFSLHGQEDGLWILSRKEAKALAAWDEVTVGARVEARVTGQNKGGLEAKIGPLSAFLPASQAGLSRIEDLSAFIGQTLECAVLEVDSGRKRVLISRRAVLEEQRDDERRESLSSIEVGATVTGKVTKIESFGAFVQVAAGLEGLVHVSNISRKRVDDPSTVLAVGQQVQVRVLSIEEGGRRIGLGMKQLEPDPWDGAEGRHPVGAIVAGKVVSLMDFGAFVELEPGLEGLLHVSQLGTERGRRVQDSVNVGEDLTVRVLSVDPVARRISLSRLDDRGALLGSEDAADGAMIDELIEQSQQPVGTNLGSLFKKALGDEKQ